MSNVSIITDNEIDGDKKEVLNRFIEFQEAMINKDKNRLNEIILDSYTLTHMSGKTQSKKEFINKIIDGTLNYYKSTVIKPEINIKDNIYSEFKADVTLDAKVYGMKGVWTLKTILFMEKIDNKWYLSKWNN